MLDYSPYKFPYHYKKKASVQEITFQSAFCLNTSFSKKNEVLRIKVYLHCFLILRFSVKNKVFRVATVDERDHDLEEFIELEEERIISGE